MLKSEYDYKEFDKFFGVENCTYEGIDVSYLVRNHFVSAIRAKHNIGNKPIVLNFDLCKRLLFSALTTVHRLFKKSSIWVFSNAERRKDYDGVYVDRVASIVGEINPSVLYIENPVLTEHKKPVRDRVASDAIFYLLSFLIGAILYRPSRLKIQQNHNELIERYGISPNVHAIIRRFWGQYKVMSFFLKWLYAPKIVYVVFPNGYSGYIRAFKEFRVPVVELQHGIIYKTHPSYNYSSDKRPDDLLPDYVFTYGSQDKECLEYLRYVKSENIYVVGSYGLWYCKNKLQLDNPYLSLINNLYAETILLSATNDDIQLLYNCGLELAERMPNLGVLLLPRTENRELQSKSNLIVLDVDKVNVFELYKSVDYHLTQNSTCALEALYMGIPSFILESERATVFSRNYQFLKSLNYINRAEALENLLLTKSYQKPIPEDVAQVFADNVPEQFLISEHNVNLNEY